MTALIMLVGALTIGACCAACVLYLAIVHTTRALDASRGELPPPSEPPRPIVIPVTITE